jgi:hypothetical protein
MRIFLLIAVLMGGLLKPALAEQKPESKPVPTLQSCDANCEARRNQPLVDHTKDKSPAESNPNWDRPIGDPCTPQAPCR